MCGGGAVQTRGPLVDENEDGFSYLEEPGLEADFAVVTHIGLGRGGRLSNA